MNKGDLKSTTDIIKHFHELFAPLKNEKTIRTTFLRYMKESGTKPGAVKARAKFWNVEDVALGLTKVKLPEADEDMIDQQYIDYREYTPRKVNDWTNRVGDPVSMSLTVDI